MTDTTNKELIPWGIGYVVLGVEDLDEAARWWTTFAMLEENGRTDDRVYLRGGTAHHWIVLQKADSEPGIHRLAFEVQKPADLNAYRAVLDAESIPFTEHEGDYTGDAIRFHDPNGYEVELFISMGDMGVSPSKPWINPQAFLHAVVAVADLDKSYDFYQRVLGLKESDRVMGKTIFLRCANQYHHSMVIGAGRGEPPLLDHVAFHFANIDDLMRVRANFLEENQPLSRDLLRHPTSGSMGFYAKAIPAPTVVEFCIDHGMITDPDHRPRALPPARWTSNVWLPPVGLNS
jgi:2,3-dihydroxy-p-cumate/2,3-dihydroxybenzoate 3,4-dioxygenase